MPIHMEISLDGDFEAKFNKGPFDKQDHQITEEAKEEFNNAQEKSKQGPHLEQDLSKTQ